MLKVLFAAAEAAPFVKTGGLGDVIGSLPKELRKSGIDVRVMLPKYQHIPAQFQQQMVCKAQFTVPVGWRQQYCGVEELEYQGVKFYFLDNQYYFQRDGFYGYYDDGERFSYFSRAVLESLAQLNFIPDVLHCHDWHTGMVSVLLDAHYRHLPLYKHIRTLFTIHNLRYQGVFPKEVLTDLLGLDWRYFTIDGLEFYDQVNFMKGGLAYSDLISTVSKTYSWEIQQPYFGEQLDGLLRKRKDRLKGIVNGIDYELYNPAADKNICSSYDVHRPDGKRENKVKLQARLGLPVREDLPLIAIISRLVGPKGMDLIEEVLPEMLEGRQDCPDFQFVVLGTGESKYENLFRQLSWKYPSKVSATIGFDQTLAQQIYAGADIFLMPSLYEPCGIGQLIAMRYGCLPIVRETGGLLDTVTPYNQYTGEGTGFSFANYNASEMCAAIRSALELYQNDETWKKLMLNAMSRNFSWEESAQEYHQLYQLLVSKGASST